MKFLYRVSYYPSAIMVLYNKHDKCDCKKINELYSGVKDDTSINI